MQQPLLSEIIGSEVVLAKDGENIGLARDFLIDGEEWIVRYAVVASPSDSEVLLSTAGLNYSPSTGKLSTTVTRGQIESSPKVDADPPLSRRAELRIHEHYGWTPYWSFDRGIPDADGAGPPAGTGDSSSSGAEIDRPLRRATELAHFSVRADGTEGEVTDLAFGSPGWKLEAIRYRRDGPGWRDQVDSEAIREIDWEDGRIVVD